MTYKNSLFQRDQPYLVKHMRMDSDVQDVFERHQHQPSSFPSTSHSNSNSNSNNAPPMVAVGPTVASFGPASSAGNGNHQQPRITTASGLQQLIASLQGQANTSNPSGTGTGADTLQAQMQQGPTANDLGMLQVLQNALNPSVVSNQNNGGSPQLPNSGSVGGESSSQQQASTAPSSSAGVFQQFQSLLTKQQEQRQQHQHQHQLQAALQQGNSGSQTDAGGLASAVAVLLQQLQQGNQNQPAPSLSPEAIRQNLLQKIVESSQQYVQQPQPSSTRAQAIFTCIRLLLVLGTQQLNQEAASPNNVSSTS